MVALTLYTVIYIIQIILRLIVKLRGMVYEKNYSDWIVRLWEVYFF
jgi:hypothetical protein